ncbi:2712_t:CDS:10 [Entrophospora sp. SA101]|nr:2712_t:CDS:10 [Entrophospora sp. SA101]
MDVSSQLETRTSNFKPITVPEKPIPLDFDLALLTAYDINVLDETKIKNGTNNYLKEYSRDNTQLLINNIYKSQLTSSQDNGTVAVLPEQKTLIPREKPLPKPKPPTKWERFAKSKGIQKYKKSRKVYDDVKDEWVPRWGYKGANNEELNDWLIPVPNNSDPYEDQFDKRRQDKKERINKNKAQQQKNLEIAQKQAPSIINSNNSSNNKSSRRLELQRQIAITKTSTASVGKFEKQLDNEPKLKDNENISNESDDYDDYDSDEEAILNIKLDDDYEKEEEDEEEEKKSSKKSINHNNDDISNDDNDDIPDLTFEMITKWQKSITESKSLKSTHRLILAFRAAAHLNDDENEKTYSYKITDPTVFNNLLVICMKYIPGVFNHHLKVEDTDVSKNKLPCFNHKWKTLELMVKSFLNNVLYILKQLTDKNMINFFTKESEKILHYYASIPKLATQYLKAVLQIWGFADDKSRILIFLNIHKLAILAPPPFIDFCLKTTAFTIPSINLMGNCAVQIYGIDFKSSYQSAFNYIRQLAINLRNAMNVKSKDSHRLIYNWQFIHCIEYWSRILGTYCDQRRIAEGGESSLQELIYPFVQVTIGVINLNSTVEYFPLRFHCIRSLINLIKTTGTFIPLATFLFDILQSKEVVRSPRPSTLKPLDFSIILKVPKNYLHTRSYQDGICEELFESFLEYYACFCKSISFPELIIPGVVQLKRHIKHSSNFKFNKQLQQLNEKLEQNSKYIEQQRSKVDFSPNNLTQLRSFLKDISPDSTPLGKFAKSMRLLKEQQKQPLKMDIDGK